MLSSESQPTASQEATNQIETTDLDQANSGQGFLPVLQNRKFLVLWGGQIFSQLADKVYLVMAIAIVASSFQISGQPISLWVSPITIAFTIPAVLFGSLAGVYVISESINKPACSSKVSCFMGDNRPEIFASIFTISLRDINSITCR